MLGENSARGHFQRHFLCQREKQPRWVAPQDTSTRSLRQSARMKESARNTYSFRNSASPWHTHTYMSVGMGMYFKSICLHCHRMQSYENNFHFVNLILEVFKMISSHYNHKISPTPTGYMGQTHLVFAQTKFEAVAQPAQKAGPSILFSIPLRVKNLEIKKRD